MWQVPQHTCAREHVLAEVELRERREVLRVEHVLKIPKFAIRKVQIAHL
jgi:hypothetical protein